MTKTLSADEFFNAVVATMRLRSHDARAIDSQLDRSFEATYQALKRVANDQGVRLTFRVRTHPVYNDSPLVRELIDAGSKNHIVDVSNPTFKRMNPKLSVAEAEALLDRLPIDRAEFERIVSVEFGLSE